VLSVTADSNIYISAFQFCGKPLQLLSNALSKRDRSVSSPVTPTSCGSGNTAAFGLSMSLLDIVGQ
jgi:hypothetical protein